MKKHVMLCLLVALLAACSQRSEPISDGYTAFRTEKFRTPDNTFRSIPFYSLNDSLTAEELDRQLQLMKEGGFGGSFLHSRIGLLTPYLSDYWFDMMTAGLQSSQRLGLEVWFYDEDKWPSGFAGGIVPRQNDDFRARWLIRTPKDTRLDALDKVLFEDEKYLYVSQIDRMGQSWYNGASWVDLMNPAMVKAFIECSYQPYVDRYAHQPQALGIFTDEPQVSAMRPLPEAQGSVSYSPLMEQAFKQLWGYDLNPVLPSLFEEIGNWRQVRLHYYRTVAYCMEQAFSKQIGNYCEANGFAWTGHYNAEQDPTGNMKNEGNLMQQLRHMQQPGVDALGLRFQPLHNGKVMTSVANQYGRKRRLVEIFGISGHNMSFEDRMWITAWHTNVGVNLMCPHLSLYSMKGERKRDFPPTINYQQPYWSQNKLFEDFSARLCYFATCGSSVPEVCILTTLESDYLVQTSSESDGKYDRQLENLMQQMAAAHVNFDLGDEQIMSEIARVADGRLQIGAMAYPVVVVPPMLTIRPTTLQLLCNLAKAGGKVVVCGEYPKFVEGEENGDAIHELQQNSVLASTDAFADVLQQNLKRQFSLMGNQTDKIWTHLRTNDNGLTLQLSNTSRIDSCHVSIRFANERHLALLNPINGECLRMQPDAEGYYALEFAPAQSWVVFNADTQPCYDGAYQPAQRLSPIATIPNQWKGRRLDPNALPLDFAEWSTDGGATWNPAEPPLAIWTRFAHSEEKYNGPMLLRYRFKVDAPVASCRLAVEQPQMYQSISVNGQPVRFDTNDYYIDTIIRSTDIHSLLRQGDNEVVLSLSFVSAIPASVNAVERYGTEIETIYLEGDFGVKGLLAAEQPTETWLSQVKQLQPRPMPTRFIHNSFALVAEQSDFSGSLTTCGYPFYAGRFELGTSFHLGAKDGSRRYYLLFPAFESTLINVSLNGVALPTLFCSPWRLDVTDALKQGDNQIRVVLTNGLRNLMGPYHNVGGEFSAVGPATFTGADSWPNIAPGDNDWYDLRKSGSCKIWRDDYFSIQFGLLGDVEIAVAEE